MRLFGQNQNQPSGGNNQIVCGQLGAKNPTTRLASCRGHNSTDSAHQDDTRSNEASANYKLSCLLKYGYSKTAKLTSTHVNRREKLFKWLMTFCQVNLELRSRTCELTMELYDRVLQRRYVFLLTICRYELNIDAGQKMKDSQIDFVTCMFVACKFEEIYPPTAYDFAALCRDDQTKDDLLNNQLKLLELLDFQVYSPLVSDWYYAATGQVMPDWGVFCLVGTPFCVESKMLAIRIREVELKKTIEQITENEESQSKRRQKFLIKMVLEVGCVNWNLRLNNNK